MTIKKLFQLKKYDSAIGQSREEPIEEFFNVIYPRIKKHRLKDIRFWQALFSEDSHHLFQSEFIYPVSREFWYLHKEHDHLIHQFAHSQPKAFIQSIRFLKLFLEDGFLERNREIMTSSSYLSLHHEMMRGLRDTLKHLQRQVSEHNSWLKEVRMEVFLAEMIIWWEAHQYETRTARSHIFIIADKALNQFFKYHKYLEPSYPWSVLEIFKKVLETHRQDEVSPILKFLDDLGNFLTHINEEIDNYCHELKHDLDAQGNYIRNKKRVVKFDQDGQKLYAFESFYKSLSESITDHQIEIGKIKLLKYNDLDYYSYQGSIMGNLILEYCSAFETMSEREVLLPQLLSMLFTHTASRYRSLINKLLLNQTPLLDALELTISAEDGIGFPIQVTRFQDFIQQTKAAFRKNIDDVRSNQIINLALSQRKNVELLSKPLIELPDNKILYLMPFAGEGNIFYRVYYNIIGRSENQKRQKADHQFEAAIAEKLQKVRFKSCNGFKYEDGKGQPHGDIDVAVLEGNEVLLMEVKRTVLRNESEGIWKEKEERFLKGSLQLYKAEKGLKDGSIEGFWDEAYDPDSKITGFIVSPWFEYDHEYIGQYMKISWFEIQYVLENLKPKWESMPNKLRAIIDLIEKDEVWPEIFKNRDRYEESMKRMTEIYQHIKR